MPKAIQMLEHLIDTESIIRDVENNKNLKMGILSLNSEALKEFFELGGIEVTAVRS